MAGLRVPSQPVSQLLEPPLRERQGSVSAVQQMTPILVAGNNTHFVPHSFHRLEVWLQLSWAFCPAQVHKAVINIPPGLCSHRKLWVLFQAYAVGRIQVLVDGRWRSPLPGGHWPRATLRS